MTDAATARGGTLADPDGPRRILIVGWDGATWALLDPLLAAGRLPNLARLISTGVRTPLRSTLPPVTPPAWTAMATGLLPGRSGVLGFRRIDPRTVGGYDPRMASSADLRGRTLFEHAASHAESVALVGWPMTWPPFELPGGVLVAGWPRPRSDVAPTWPAALGRTLGQWGRGDPAPRWREPTLEEEIASAQWWDRRHAEIACRWLRERDDGVTAVVFPGTDHLSHRLWGDPRLAEHFERVDQHLGEVRDAAGEGTATLLVSDHGFGPAPRRRVHVDRALAERGLLRWADPARRTPTARLAAAVRRGLPKRSWHEVRDRLPEAVRAWAAERAGPGSGIDPDGTQVSSVEVYVGLVGLCVHEPVDLVGLLEGLRAEPWVGRIDVREDLFDGRYLDRIPEVLLELADDCCLGLGWGPGPICDDVPAEDLRRWPATHRRAGILVASGPGIRSPSVAVDVGVEDVGPTWLALAGLPIPDDLDGRAANELIVASPRYESVERAEPAATGRPPGPDLESSLRRLGYLR